MVKLNVSDLRKNAIEIEKEVMADYRTKLVPIKSGVDLERNESDFFNFMYITAWDSFRHLILNAAQVFIDKTRYACQLIHDGVTFDVELFRNDKVNALHYMLSMLNEYNFWQGSVISGTPSVLYDGNYLKRLDDVTGNILYGRDFKWITTEMGFSIARYFIETDEVKALGELVSDFKNKNKTLVEATSKLDENLRKANSLAERIETFKNDLNFISLSKAFSRMKATKLKELTWANVRFGLFMVALISIPLLILYKHNLGQELSWGLLIYYVPAVTLEVLFIYFMRLFYSETKSIKAQLLQLDLRLSLCEFIQEYVRYRVDCENADEVLKSFETLVFSPIQATEDNIPPMLDGVGALAELANKVMSRGN
ncbi:TPA: hypothetical protein R4Y05_003257 [Serratia liquefaciens]|nr:hypothetical protein [Serratia liquefaciens]